jgi:hypothetical protein
MKFLLLCYDDEKYWESAGESVMQAAIGEAVQLTHDLDAKGQYIRSAALHRSSSATCVRIRDGKRLVTDGPFAETREVLGGFHLIDVPDLETAIAVAKRHPGVHVGSVEIRAVRDLPEMLGVSR